MKRIPKRHKIISSTDDLMKTTIHFELLFSQLLSHKTSIAVLGLTTTGQLLTTHMSTKFKVIAYDSDTATIKQLASSNDEGSNITYSKDETVLKLVKFYIITTAVPIDAHKKPNLTPLKSMTATVARNLKRGDCVVFEATVYPGCIEQVCIPILERISRLRYNQDFTIGYSPSLPYSNHKQPVFSTQKKIVASSHDLALSLIAQVYEAVIDAGVCYTPNIQIAEAITLVQHIQKDVNVGLLNELTLLFQHLKIDLKKVLRNMPQHDPFYKLSSGFMNRHQLSTITHHLLHTTKEQKYGTRFLQLTKEINDEMIRYLVLQIEQKLHVKRFEKNRVSILVKGIASKANTHHIQNSKSAKLCLALQKRAYTIVIQDYLVNPKEVKREYGLEMVTEITETFDAIILAVAHDKYQAITYRTLLANSNEDTIIYDLIGNRTQHFPTSVYISL